MNPINLDDIMLYHIVHIDKLPLILQTGNSGLLLSDREVHERSLEGTTIGMSRIKARRMNELKLTSYPDLCVGDCVPFYFCPRSIMLYMFSMNNHSDIAYHGGQEPIAHLVLRMMDVIRWADQSHRRWVFTDSNAGSFYFNDSFQLQKLDMLNWDAIHASDWRNCKEEKQAEFLVEHSVPWELVSEIGVFSETYRQKVGGTLADAKHIPPIHVKRHWYY